MTVYSYRIPRPDDSCRRAAARAACATTAAAADSFARFPRRRCSPDNRANVGQPCSHGRWSRTDVWRHWQAALIRPSGEVPCLEGNSIAVGTYLSPLLLCAATWRRLRRGGYQLPRASSIGHQQIAHRTAQYTRVLCLLEKVWGYCILVCTSLC